MEIIRDLEEFTKEYFRIYPFYKGTEKDLKRAKEQFKNEIMIRFDDKYILLLDNKAGIESELLYDDELPRPEKTKEYFMNYNINWHSNYSFVNEYLKEKERLQKEGCASGRYDYNGIKLEKANDNGLVGLDVEDFRFESDKYKFVRYLSNEEQEELLKIIDMIHKNYIERLEKYWNRYQDKIHCRGYWVNR